MIISELSQKRGLFNKKKITLKSNKLLVEETTVQSKKKYEIDLDKIGYEKYYEADNTSVGKIATAIFFIIPLFFIGAYIFGKIEAATVILIIISCWLFVILSLLKSNKDDIFLVGGTQSFSLYRNKPDEETVLAFIDEIVETAKEYTKKEYINIENYSSREDYCSMLKYLRGRGTLSQKEFDFLIKESQYQFLIQ